MRRLLFIMLPLIAALASATAARAVVVDPSAFGQASIAYPTDQSNYVGVAMVPGTRADLSTAHLPTVSSSVSSCDPWLSADLALLPAVGLCAHGGPVMHANETFALTWDPSRSYWATTRNYIEQFLKDVGDGSGTLSSPYAVTSQYRDASGRAANASKYGGGCIDYGNPGGYTCQFGNTTGTGVGNNYPANGCTPAVPTDSCLTDGQIRTEVAWEFAKTQLTQHLMPGYKPLLVLLTPPTVEVCLDAAGTVCSANRTATAQFCSYHGTVNGTAYVVQPWTAHTACDEPNLPALPANPTAQQLAIDAGLRLVSPLSQSHIAAIVNPGLNGWFAEDGSETEDNYGCVPNGDPFDAVTVGGSAQYYLSPEFNNAGVINTDPNTPACALGVALAPTFVVPSAVEPGDLIQLDGSVTDSTLIVPAMNYVWHFGDGTTAIGPSVEHAYAKAGAYTVMLTVTDRGGNTASISQNVGVLGSAGQPVTPPTQNHTSSALRAHIQLLPQGLSGMLHRGLAIRLTSNRAADGFVTLSISRQAAKRAHLPVGRGGSVVIGRGTVSGIKHGTVRLTMRVSRAMAAKLGHLNHVTVTIKLALVAAGHKHLTIDAAAHY